MRRLAFAAALATLALAGACVPDNTAFAPTIDASMPDADPGAAGIPLEIQPARIDFGETDTETLRVHLSGAPSAPVEVLITGIEGVVTVSPDRLTFDGDDWPTDQYVLVTALDDDDADDEDGAIAFDDDGEVVARATVPVTVEDHDMLRFVTSVDSLEIDDRGAADVSVRLEAAPTTEIIVDVSVDDGTAATAAPGQLRFTPEDWDQDQTIHVEGVDDPDANHEDTFVELDGGDNIPPKQILLHVIDGDILGIQLESGTVHVNEEGPDGELRVSLTQQPSATTTVTLSESSDAFALGDTSLEFTTQNWSEPQSVAVIPASDVDVTDELGEVVLAGTNIPDTRTATITVVDDDVQEIFHDAGATLALAEGTTKIVNVSLRWRPAAPTTVTVVSDDATSAHPLESSVLIQPENYGAPHPVHIVGEQDDDLANETPHITLDADDIAPKSFDVAVTDNDTQDLVFNSTSITINENVTSSSLLTVKLDFQPASTTSVTISSNNPAVTVGQTSQTLTFTTTNWDTPQGIQLSAPIDSDAEGEVATITATGGGVTRTATVTVADQTVIQTFGWTTWFGASTSMPSGYIIAYRFVATQNGTLSRLGVLTESAGGAIKMALYANVDTMNMPGALLSGANVSTGLDTPHTIGPNFVEVDDVPITAGVTYWIAFRLQATTSIGYSSSTSVRQCSRSFGTYAANWPTNFEAATCVDDAGAVNVLIEQYHQ